MVYLIILSTISIDRTIHITKITYIIVSNTINILCQITNQHHKHSNNNNNNNGPPTKKDCQESTAIPIFHGDQV